ncbi:hypothetical protein BC826DRAFT_1109210 [Russula brevipes]|nr:hypothetical protein BC826DRAFT_1109210 [Russula brevipes]
MINSSTVLAALAPPSPTAGTTWPRLPRRGVKRPRGLWKARRRLDSASSLTQHQMLQTAGGGCSKSCSSGRGSDTDRDVDESGGEMDDDDISQDSSSSKRQRRDSGRGSVSGTSSSNNSSVELWAICVDADADVRTSPPAPSYGGVAPENTSSSDTDTVRAPLISNMITTSIAENASSGGGGKVTYEYGDWEEIRETLTRASELCDREDPSGSMPLLRAVIHECHRFLVRFPDPSLFFSRPVVVGQQRRREGSGSPDSVVRPGSRSEERRWHQSRDGSGGRRGVTPPTPPAPDYDMGQSRPRSHHRESPTAFHAALGVALFLFGNIIAQNPSLALSREPTTPSSYWLAALDVFNAGDNLPCRTNGDDGPSDAASADNWRVAIAWGRTLVALAYEATKKASSPPAATATMRPPRYAPRSPLTAIAALRTAGLAHVRASAPELLTLAADQFARGIFHMPHAHRAPARPRALFTLASEVLGVAERLDTAVARRRWAQWADAVFLQMHMEADVDAWRVRVGVARGRCWLAVGSARADELEDALERGDVSVLLIKEAEEARAGLAMAVSFFDRAKGSASTESCEASLVDMQPWLAEALLSLANLMADEGAREALYARAQAEGGEAVARELAFKPSRSRSRTLDVRMDES